MKQRMKVSDKNTQIGIDIGTSKICCSITEINSDEGSNKILGVGNVPSQGMKKGSIVHRDKVMDAIEAAVREAELMAGIKVNRAMLSISGDHIRGINTQGAIAIQKGSARNVPVEQEITQNDVSRVLELAKAVSLPVDREILHILAVVNTADRPRTQFWDARKPVNLCWVAHLVRDKNISDAASGKHFGF